MQAPCLLRMMNSIKNKNILATMLDLCRQVTPSLDGRVESPSFVNRKETNNHQWLIGQDRDLLTIQALRNNLTKKHPHAGQAYLQARTWQLLCWQPIYITFISLYRLQMLPNFTEFKQQRQQHSVAGFTLQNRPFKSAAIEQLIPIAAIQLKVLLEHYRIQLNLLARCRPGYSNRFIADIILGILVNVKEINLDLNNQTILSHAALWFKWMELPTNLIESLKINANQPIHFIRTSCCLADKINEELCTNCPKVHKQNQNKATQKRQSTKQINIQIMAIN